MTPCSPATYHGHGRATPASQWASCRVLARGSWIAEGLAGGVKRRRPGWWTRSQWTRTAAALPLVVELRNAVVTPIYQAMAPQALELRDRGVSVARIALLFGVDHHTAKKALRWGAER